MPVESLDGRKHHHGDHNREKVFSTERETLVLVLLSLTRSLCVSLSRVGIISVEKENMLLMFSFFFLLKQTTNNPLDRLVADWLVSVEMAAPTPERSSQSPPLFQLSLFPYGSRSITLRLLLLPPFFSSLSD